MRRRRPSTPGAEVAAAAVVQATDQAAPETRAERRAAHEVTSQEHLVGHKVYTVAAPRDGYHDNLWDIAERLLGDGRRYREIYELNKGLVQPDGRKLELARLIQPGWNLVVPDDAVGVHRMTAPPTSAAPDEHRFDAGASHGHRRLRAGCPGESGRPARYRPAGRDRVGGPGLRAAPAHRCERG